MVHDQYDFENSKVEIEEEAPLGQMMNDFAVGGSEELVEVEEESEEVREEGKESEEKPRKQKSERKPRKLKR